MSISARRVKQRRGVQPLIINLYIINYFELLLLFAIFVSVTKDAVFNTIQTFVFTLCDHGRGYSEAPLYNSKATHDTATKIAQNNVLGIT